MRNDKDSISIQQWFQGFLDALPSDGQSRAKALKQIDKALTQRDTFRLQKLSKKHGFNEKVPTDALRLQLEHELALFPCDLVGNANRLSEFLEKANNPLLGPVALQNGNGKRL